MFCALLVYVCVTLGWRSCEGEACGMFFEIVIDGKRVKSGIRKVIGIGKEGEENKFENIGFQLVKISSSENMKIRQPYGLGIRREEGNREGWESEEGKFFCKPLLSM